MGPRIVYLFDRDDEAYDNVCNGEVDSCGHVVVKLSKQYLDSNGFQNPQHVKMDMQLYREYEMEPRRVKESINRSSWNWQFKRAKHVKTIEKILDVSLDWVN